MPDLNALLRFAIDKRSTDLHLGVDLAPMLRIEGDLVELSMPKLTQFDIEQMIFGIINERQKKTFLDSGELDFGFTFQNSCRFRINIFKERGNIAAAFRLIPVNIPTLDAIGLPKTIEPILDLVSGLALVTGPTGCGKSTTLAAMINYLNNQVAKHVITIEDPIEYIFTKIKCKFSQREIPRDSASFRVALKYILRQDPDIILIGEMRDSETITAAITCAETGHLVFSTLHTIDTSQTVDRIIDSFPGDRQEQIRFQISMLLQFIVSQRLLKKTNGGLIAAREILIATDSIRNVIREQKTQQIYSILQTSAKDGMITMDNSIFNLYRSGLISKEIAYLNTKNKEEFKRKVLI